MHRWLIRLLSFGILLVVLTGCITFQAETTIQNDGSGTNVMYVGFSKQLMEEMSEMAEEPGMTTTSQNEDPFSDIEDDVQEFPPAWNAQAEPWENEQYIGAKVTMDFTDLDMLEAQLNQTLGPESASEDATSGSMFQHFDVQQEGNTVTITTSTTKDETMSADEGEMAAMSGMLGFNISWSIEMPGLTSYTAKSIAIQDGNRVTWRIPIENMSQSYDIEVRGTLDGSSTANSPATEATEPTPASQPPAEAAEVSESSAERCFENSDHCISGEIQTYWEEHNGNQRLGLPISPWQEEVINGEPVQVQWFERARLEVRPNNPAPFNIILGKLGVEALETQDRPFYALPNPSQQGNECLYFSTGYTVCDQFLQAMRSQGIEFDQRSGYSLAENIALFGLPLSNAMRETLSDGKQYTVQYFERTRLELHPTLDPPNRVQFGPLGKELGP